MRHKLVNYREIKKKLVKYKKVLVRFGLMPFTTKIFQKSPICSLSTNIKFHNFYNNVIDITNFITAK
jgi:hypothetical protein